MNSCTDIKAVCLNQMAKYFGRKCSEVRIIFSSRRLLGGLEVWEVMGFINYRKEQFTFSFIPDTLIECYESAKKDWNIISIFFSVYKKTKTLVINNQLCYFRLIVTQKIDIINYI